VIIELDEWSTSGPVELTTEQVRALNQHDAFNLRPHIDRPDRWSIGARHKVGAIALAGLELRVRPKVDVPALLALLSEAAGRIDFDDDAMPFGTGEQLLPIVAGAFCRHAESATRLGLLQGYQTIDEALLAVKGRLNLGAQVARRAGMVLPVEVTYDDYTTDIIENQLLAGATRLLLSLSGVVDHHQLRLLRLRRRLDGVTPTRPTSTPPTVPITRLNTRYSDALAIARLILSSAALEDGNERTVSGTGMLVDMNRIFEDVVGSGLRRVLESYEGHVAFQDTRNLDRAGHTTIRPDVVWQIDGRPVAVIDAKYKLPSTSEISNPDVYQVLVYAARYRLANVHLVYAERPPVSRLEVGDITVHLHHLDIGLTTAERERSCEAICELIRMHVVPTDDRVPA
jgi:5-methylcytosine-specific restriction enzyme subunit McrC